MDAANIGANSIKYVIGFIVLLLLQVLVCNNILLFGIAVPLPFIYFIIALPLALNLNLVILFSFLIGFLVDLFSDTLGLNSTVCLLTSILRKPIFYAYMPKEDKNINIIPSLSTMGWENFLKFSITFTILYCLIIFFVEFTSFASFGRIIAMSMSSALLTTLVILGLDALFKSSSTN